MVTVKEIISDLLGLIDCSLFKSLNTRLRRSKSDGHRQVLPYDTGILPELLVKVYLWTISNDAIGHELSDMQQCTHLTARRDYLSLARNKKKSLSAKFLEANRTIFIITAQNIPLES